MIHFKNLYKANKVNQIVDDISLIHDTVTAVMESVYPPRPDFIHVICCCQANWRLRLYIFMLHQFLIGYLIEYIPELLLPPTFHNTILYPAPSDILGLLEWHDKATKSNSRNRDYGKGGGLLSEIHVSDMLSWLHNFLPWYRNTYQHQLIFLGWMQCSCRQL